MWNPFTSPLAQSTAYDNPEPMQGRDNVVMPNTPVIDDAYTPGTLPYEYYGPMNEPTQDSNPAYAGRGSRTLVLQGGQEDTHLFLNPAPGSVDLIAPRDSGGIPATVEENIRGGPVSGWVMDSYGYIRQDLLATPPGQAGPVVGGTPQDQLISQAYWQQAFSQYSNQASDQANVMAI